MASDIWTLNKNAGSYSSLRSLGIVGAKVTKASLDMGSLTLLVPVLSITAAAPFAYGDELILRRSGVIWFVGRVRILAITFSGGRAAWSVGCYDSWWEMEHMVYRQPRVVSNDAGTGYIAYMSSRVTLNQDAWGREIDQGAQLTNAIYYAQGQAPAKISLSAVPTIASIWGKEETREITVAEAVRRAVALAPSAFATRTYGAAIMTMAFAARAGLTLATLDLNAANLIVEVAGLRRRDDLIPPGVVFDFETTFLDAKNNPKTKITRQYAGAPGGPGTIYSSFNLGPCDSIPLSAAAAYYAALASAQWDGTITTMEQECSGSVAPGYRVRLSNGQAAWAAMDAVVQRTTEDLDHGITTIELGPPDVLGLDDFVGQLNRFRNRPAPTSYCITQHNGTEGAPVGKDDTGHDIPPPGDTGEGDHSGVNGPATGHAPGGAAPAANPKAGGTPAAAAAAAATGSKGSFGTTTLTLCDGSSVTVVTMH